jgi:uncharacterized membrane protein YbhN (UPF0104 family)
MSRGVRTWAVRIVTAVFFVAVAWLLARQARTIDWDTVGQTLRSYRAGTLGLAAALVAASYAAYAGYELLARAYSGHGLPVRLVALVGLIAYSFNLNLGAWVGGIGFRYRLYSQLGVSPATTARLYLSTLATNWTGYILIAGIAFASYGLDLPDEWKLSDEGLRWIGVLLLAVAPCILLACARARRRRWTLRGHEFELPGGRLAAVQMALGALNWMLMGAVMYTLLPHVAIAPHYGTVLATLLIACIAGVVTHIPAGLGVLEAVFLALLGHRVPHAQLLGALLAYRALYYLVPLVVAGVAYALLESRLKQHRSLQRTAAAAPGRSVGRLHR